MDKKTAKKILSMSFLSAAFLAYVVVEVLFKTMAGAFGVVQHYYSMNVIAHGLPISAAILTFAALQFNPKIVTWAEEVVSEVSKVVWPSRKDTVAMTMVVCFFVAAACVLLLGIDFLARNFVQLIIH